MPHIHDVWLRYDPPVLLIGATWKETRHPFIALLQHRLRMSYYDSAVLVSLTQLCHKWQALTPLQVKRVDISLEGILEDTVVFDDSTAGETTQPKEKPKGKKKSTPKAPASLEDIDNFMTHYPTAKIVIVIETHCLENGCFVWKGESPTTYEACSLLEVYFGCDPPQHLADISYLQILQGCIPQSIFQYISSASDTPEHHHRSLIVNLSCGPSINNEIARHSLLNG